MALLDLLGRRMTLRILWELSNAPAPLTFRALLAAADTNPSVLNSRLGELRAAGVVESAERGYALTVAGRALAALVMPLNEWAGTWAKAWNASS